MQITSLDFYADYFTKPRPGNFRLMVERSHSWDGLKLQLNLGLLCRGQMTLFGTFSFHPRQSQIWFLLAELSFVSSRTLCKWREQYLFFCVDLLWHHQVLWYSSTLLSVAVVCFFLLLNSTQMYKCNSLCTLVDRHLGCFQFLRCYGAQECRNVCERVFVWKNVFICLG